VCPGAAPGVWSEGSEEADEAEAEAWASAAAGSALLWGFDCEGEGVTATWNNLLPLAAVPSPSLLALRVGARRAAESAIPPKPWTPAMSCRGDRRLGIGHKILIR